MTLDGYDATITLMARITRPAQLSDGRAVLMEISVAACDPDRFEWQTDVRVG